MDTEFSQDEIYSLYCALSFNGVDYGAERLARRMFNKSLEALSEDEMATVASILWSPIGYKKIYRSSLPEKLSDFSKSGHRQIVFSGDVDECSLVCQEKPLVAKSKH